MPLSEWLPILIEDIVTMAVLKMENCFLVQFDKCSHVHSELVESSIKFYERFVYCKNLLLLNFK